MREETKSMPLTGDMPCYREPAAQAHGRGDGHRVALAPGNFTRNTDETQTRLSGV
jgi:hypothetical protein